MSIEIVPHSQENMAIVWRMMQLYWYDTQIENEFLIDETGVFSSPDEFNKYWFNSLVRTNLIKKNGIIVGFILLHRVPEIFEAAKLSDIFVLRGFRRVGVASEAILKLVQIMTLEGMSLCAIDYKKIDFFESFFGKLSSKANFINLANLTVIGYDKNINYHIIPKNLLKFNFLGLQL